jgi:hypothetical protein
MAKDLTVTLSKDLTNLLVPGKLTNIVGGRRRRRQSQRRQSQRRQSQRRQSQRQSRRQR